MGNDELNRTHEIANFILIAVMYIGLAFAIFWGIKSLAVGFYGAVDYMIQTLKVQEKIKNE